MTSLITKIGLAALVALGGVSANAAAASAAGPELSIQVQFRDEGRHGRPGPGWGHGDRRHHDSRPHRPRPSRGCSPWEAQRKAERFGLYRARVVDASHRRVVVAGFTRRGPERIVFANERGCPVIRR